MGFILMWQICLNAMLPRISWHFWFGLVQYINSDRTETVYVIEFVYVIRNKTKFYHLHYILDLEIFASLHEFNFLGIWHSIPSIAKFSLLLYITVVYICWKKWIWFSRCLSFEHLHYLIYVTFLILMIQWIILSVMNLYPTRQSTSPRAKQLCTSDNFCFIPASPMLPSMPRYVPVPSLHSHSTPRVLWMGKWYI